MGMNIKNPETHRLAQELARLTGTTITEAVTEALREKIKGLKSPSRKKREIMEILCSEDDGLTEAQRKQRVEHDLYDEHGLPR